MRPLTLLGWLLAFACAIGFCLPWLKFEASPAAAPAQRQLEIARQVAAAGNRPWWKRYFSLDAGDQTAALSSPLEGVPGWELPQLSHGSKRQREQAATVRSAGLFGQDRLEDRLWFAWAAPAGAALGALFLWGCRRRKAPLLLPMALCGGFYLIARHRWNETCLNRLAFGLHAGPGLWVCLYALLGIALFLALRLALPRNSRF